MTAFRFFDGNLGFSGMAAFGGYSVTSQDGTHMVLDWNGSGGALDPTRNAAEITFTYTGYQSYNVEDGPDAGQTRVTAGTLTEVDYLNGTGGHVVDITGFAVKLPLFLATLGRGDSYSAWQMITHAGGATITGSNNASGPGHTGTGDFIDTTAGNDVVNAGSGDDFLQDRGGADTYAGGLGFDTLAYDGWNYTPWLITNGVDLDQLLGTCKGPDGQADKISGIENVTGTYLNDFLRGNASNNQFEGGAGADYIDGRGGRDTVSYAQDAGWGGTDGIRVNLANNSVRDGFGFNDKVLNVEIIVGTAVHDTFFDNAADNYFDGGAGNDTFHFTLGNDGGHGGAGADTFYFDGNFADDTVDDFHVAEGDKIHISAATAYAQLHLANISTEQGPATLVTFGSNTVTLVGVVMSDLQASDFGF